MAKTREELVEQRKHKRFQVHSGAFVTLKPSDTYVGRIIDIGLDGLAFEYVDGEEPSGHPNELEIFVKGSSLRLTLIHFEQESNGRRRGTLLTNWTYLKLRTLAIK